MVSFDEVETLQSNCHSAKLTAEQGVVNSITCSNSTEVSKVGPIASKLSIVMASAKWREMINSSLTLGLPEWKIYSYV